MRRKKLGNGKLSNLYSGIHVVFASLFNDTFVCISVMYTIQNIGIYIQSLEYFFFFNILYGFVLNWIFFELLTSSKSVQ